MSKLGSSENMEFLSRNCPSCGSSSNQATPAMHSTPRAEELSFDELSKYWRGFRKKNIFFSYFRCSSCNLLYCPVYFTGTQLQELYSFMGDNTAGEQTNVLSMTHASYLRSLSKNVDINGKWLELGGDIGLLTKQLLTLPGVNSVDVLEPNLSVHAQLTEILDSRGKVAASWPGLTDEREFEGVIAIHVLDHLLDLRSELDVVSDKIKNGGSVFFVTHDESSTLRRILKSKWIPFCLQHPQLFSPESIANALELSGFQRIHVSKTYNYFSLRHIVEVATSVIGAGKFLTRLCPNISLKLKLGNVATYAQKVGLAT